MEDQYWKKCQYYAAENCPDELRILLDQAHLIPHLLDYSEIEAAKQVCKECKKQERRNSYRLNRPLAVVLTNQQPNTSVEGTVINSSASGALVKLKEWKMLPMVKCLKLYSLPQTTITHVNQVAQ